MIAGASAAWSSQYDHATVGSGSILDEVKYTYDDWGNVTLFEQDRDGAVVSMGNQYSVAYAYAKAGSGGSGRHAVRCTGMTLPSGASLTYEYLGVSSARLDDALSRVSRIKHGSTIVASYRYTGLGMVVEEALNQPNVTTLTHGSSMGDYPYLDNFNRVTDSRWQAGNASNVPFYRVALTYDRNGNITTAEDHVHTVGTAGSGNGLFDAVYTMDNLDRVTEAREGHLSGGAIANTSDTKRDQQWTLDQVGNWKNEKLDLSGGAVNWTGAGEYQQDGTFNLANEWTKREQDTNATPGYENTYTMAYDGVGNMTDDGKDYKYVYDVFGRLVEVKTQGGATVTKYRYNGLGYRIMWQYDNDGTAGFNAGTDKKFYFVYDTRWRMVATYREPDTDPKEEFTNHNAGMDGKGTSSYIDSVVMRDKDANTAWATAAADGVLEQRYYYCQNWRGDVSAIVTDTGKMVEWVKYSAYGVPFGIPAGDTNSKGFYLPADNAFMATGQTYDIRRDVNMDGVVNGADATHAASIAGGFQTLGRGVLSSTAVANRKGYAGYENDGSIWRLDHVRNRVFHKELGRWTKRDPLGYVDGMNLYEYVRGRIAVGVDPFGLAMDIGIHYGTPCSPGGGVATVGGCADDTPTNPWDEYQDPDRWKRSDCKRDKWQETTPPYKWVEGDKECVSKCQGNDGLFGRVDCDKYTPDGKKTKCCICNGHIRSEYPNTHPTHREIISLCVLTHEEWHWGIQPDCDGSKARSYECQAYQAQLKCLEASKGKCNELPKSSECNKLIDKEIERVKARIKAKCDPLPPGDPDKPDDNDFGLGIGQVVVVAY